MRAPRAIGEVRSLGADAISAECDALRAILAAQPRTFDEVFVTAPSPGIVACAMENAHYPTLGAYVGAVADALRVEYEAIVAHGFLLQIDAPDLAMERHTLFADRPLDAFLAFVDTVIDATRRALANVPRERVRLHVCWGTTRGRTPTTWTWSRSFRTCTARTQARWCCRWRILATRTSTACSPATPRRATGA